MATPVPPTGTVNIIGSVMSAQFNPPIVIGDFGVLLLRKDTPVLAAQDCFPSGLEPVRLKADGTFTIPNVPMGQYTVLAYRRTSDHFERTSVLVNVVDRDVPTGPIRLLAPLDADVRDGGRRDDEIVTWRAPAGGGFLGLAYRTSQENPCYSTDNDLEVEGAFQTDTTDNMELVKVLIHKESTQQVAIRIRDID